MLPWQAIIPFIVHLNKAVGDGFGTIQKWGKSAVLYQHKSLAFFKLL